LIVKKGTIEVSSILILGSAMSIKLHQWVLPTGVMLLCISLVIYKLLGSTADAAHFVSGVLAGIAITMIATYVYVAFETGAPFESDSQ
jgi:hypothetical protein